MASINVFISYSHENENWLAEWLDPVLQTVNPRCLLRQWQRTFRKENVEFWFDREQNKGLRGGDRWRDRIFEEIDRADIAVLLVTQQFVISPFIMDEELPHILERHKQGKMEVLPLLIQPTRLKGLQTGDFLQWAPGKPTPLSAYFDRGDNAFSEACNEVLDALEAVIQRVRTRQGGKAPSEATVAALGGASTTPGKATMPGLQTDSTASVRSAGNDVPAVAEAPAAEVALERKDVSSPAKPPGTSAPASPMTAKPTPVAETQSVGPVRPGPSQGMQFVEIPAGEFTMGSNAWGGNAKPAHRVRITRPFQLQTTPVTQAQWEAVMGTNPSHFKGSKGPNRPVEMVSWTDVQEFLTKLTARGDGYRYRLPTEAEWEYACRAGGREPDVSPNLDEEAWHRGNSGDKPHPVAMKKPNGWGLYDMRGNVCEWVADWYEPYDIDSVDEVQIDPQGPKTGAHRVVRAGSWHDDPSDRFRCAFRYELSSPTDSHDFFGFRCARIHSQASLEPTLRITGIQAPSVAVVPATGVGLGGEKVSSPAEPPGASGPVFPIVAAPAPVDETKSVGVGLPGQLQALLGRLLPNFAKPGRAEVPDVSGATPTTVTVSPPAIANESETPIELTRASSDSTLWVFASNAICFVVGSLDSKVRTFCYEAGTAVPFSKTGKDDGWTWYQVPGNGGKDLWLRGYDASTVYADDKRVFCRIAETGHVGYLVEIWGDRNAPHGSIDEIRIVDHLLGYVQIKSDQIVSIVAKQGEMSVKTKEAGDFAGELQKLGNYSGASFTMGPCLVTGDAVIALVRTKRPHPLTLQRIAEGDRPRLVPERFYWERSQLKFRIAARAAVGHFDESVCDGHIHFVEQSLGWMRISIPQIKKLTVDAECRDAPIAIETFVGNVYRGVCPERFNLSGTMISFDKIKNLVLEAFNRDSSSH